MPANYPNSLAVLTNPNATDYLNVPSHSDIETQQNLEIVAVQTELGLGLKGSLTNLAARLNVSINSNGTLKAEGYTLESLSDVATLSSLANKQLLMWDSGDAIWRNASISEVFTAQNLSLGTTTQIPYMNAGGTDFLYSAGNLFDGNSLLPSNILVTPSTLGADKITNGNFSSTTGWTLGTGWSAAYVFTVSGISTSPGINSTYTNNGVTFTTRYISLSGTAPNRAGFLVMTGSSAPTSTGTLVKASGTGDNNVVYSAVVAGAVYHITTFANTLTQASADMVTPLVAGEWYELTFTILNKSSAAMSCEVTIGGATISTVTANGTYKQAFRATTTEALTFTPTTLSRFGIDDVILQKCSGMIQGAGLLLSGTSGSPMASGAGTRLMWVPEKGAFRCGQVSGNAWDYSNLGSNSIAMGYDCLATQGQSIALGSGCSCTGASAVAMGDSSYVTFDNSVAIGLQCHAYNYNTTAIGYACEANAFGATALGTSAFATGTASVCIGGNSIGNTGAVGIGGGCEVSGAGDYAIVIGTTCVATGLYGIAMGIGSQATATSAFASGTHCYATAYSAIAIGYATVASAQGAFACGFNDNDDTTSFNASGDASVAFGYCSSGGIHQSSGINSIVMGKDLGNTANYSAAFGREYSVTTDDSFNMGWGQLDYQFTATLATMYRTFKTDGGIIGKITTVTDTYQILVTDETIVCNKATAFTCTLPTGVVGQVFSIKNIGAGLVTVSLAGDTIDGETSQTVDQWSCMKVQCYAANAWGII
jgi:hypothetical protein